ncbi:uncharacterized protein PHALS_14567 [Plasmopara halstedii]|uniref:Uncharacterized protein n=1 Tax=Plasmopara halstedii TaxID=4781 RepID=A0A0N7L5L3_PLAHL|nr:uncharacterized protein PHALS_14567 [Plasmopara halstedii]CEG41795.1 hypothetical protein PHALS_14567 [Plasmopara halstedii]|eukprot:XP_024578164.1 hypothetical protein PHALS_14567 [Plasmopara halstedii]
MSHVKDRGLEGFLKDGLHVVPLFYVSKLFSFEGSVNDQTSDLLISQQFHQCRYCLATTLSS